MPAGPDLILASASPRRRELLERAGLRLRIAAPDIDETPADGERAADYVRRMAVDKVAAALRTVAATPAGPADGESAAHVPILAADTIVILRGAILGKPRDEADARAMLQRLAGHRHEVTTAYRIAFGSRQAERAVTTAVAFRLIDPAELDAYVAGGEWRGKAGSYAVQGVAAAFVTELRGSPTNVIGLPLPEVLADLRALGALPAYPPERFPTVA
jgi:nucleoside triphosphate pyrophosphatase